MTVEVMSRDLCYSGKPGRSFRKSKEDLALFESINDLPDSNDLDSCLVDVDALAGDQLLKKGTASDSDAEKNDDDWLVPAPEASVSLQSHPSNLVQSRNLSAIKTTRSATLEPARVSTPQRNPSPRVYKGTPQESKVSPSRIPRFNASVSNVTVRKSSPGPTLIPRASSSPRASTPSSSAIPRASSSPRSSTSSSSAIPRASSSPRSSMSSSAIPRASSSPRTSISGIRPPSPRSKWTASTKPTPSTKATPAQVTPRGASSPKFTRASTITPSISTGRKVSSNRGNSARTSPSSSSIATNLPSQPDSARSVQSVTSQVSTSKAAKGSFAYELELSETPANLRTDPFTKRSSSQSLHVRSLSRSYEGPSSESQDYVTSSDLSRSQDRGAFQHSSFQTSDGRASNSDEDNFPSSLTKIPAYHGGGGVGRRTLKKDDGLLQELSSQQSSGSLQDSTVLYDKSTAKEPESSSSIMPGFKSSIPDPSCSTGYTAQAESSLYSNFGFKPFVTNNSIPSFSQHRKPVSTGDGRQGSGEDMVTTNSSKDRFGYGKVEPGSNTESSQASTVTRTRIQMGFALKREDVVATHTLELPTSSLIGTKATNMEMAIPHLSTTAMISDVEEQGPVKVYQGLGDMEDMEDRGGNWCCGMADRYRGLCRQHECVIFKNFHTALVVKNASNPQTLMTMSSQDGLNEKLGSEPDPAPAGTGSSEHNSSQESEQREDPVKPACQPIDSTPISKFLQQLRTESPNIDPEGSAERSSSSASSSCATELDEEERRVTAAAWKVKAASGLNSSPEDTPSLESKARRPSKGDSSSGKNKNSVTSYSKWSELDITEISSQRSRQLGKPPDFFDVTKRNVEDGGVVAAISSVKSVSTSSECDDDDQTGKNFLRSSNSSPELLNRSSSMNGSHVSRSDSDDEEEEEELDQTRAFSPESDADLAMSDSEAGDMVNQRAKASTSNYLESETSDYNDHDASAHSDGSQDDSSPRELLSQFSRASSTKSNVRRFLSTSATSIDLTRSIDTTCSTQSPYEYHIWEEPSDSGRYGDPSAAPSNPRPGSALGQNLSAIMGSSAPEPVPVTEEVSDDEPQASALYDYGLEKLAGYIRSASVNTRKRRASVTSSESDSKTSLSRESSFDYFVDFFEAQTNLDPEARAVADLLVSAHVDSAKRVDHSPKGSSSSSSSNVNLKRVLSRLSSDKSVAEVVVPAKEETWESNKSIQTLENSGEGTEQIVENATLASLDKHFSSFKFGQKKYPAGEFESITTLEVVPESPPSDSALSPSRRRFSKQFNEMIPEPSPLCQKFLKEIEEQHNLCEGIALSALTSAPLSESVVRKSVDQVRYPKEEEEGLHASPASPPGSPVLPNCLSPRVSSANRASSDSCNEIQGAVATVQVVTVQTMKVEVEVDVEVEKDKAKDKEKDKAKDKEKDKDKEKEDEKVKENEKAEVKPDESSEPDSQIEIEKAVVEQVLRPPVVPKQMSKGSSDTPVMSPKRMTSRSSPTKRASGNEVGDHNDRACGCTIL